MTRIAVSVKEPGLDTEVEYRFGRAPYLLVVDPETLEWDAVDNPGGDGEGGAGVRAARRLAELGVDAVAGGEFGPNADAALRSAGITVHRCEPGTTVREAIALAHRGDRAGP